jgi:phosphatidylserine/phosphatidylglycerophosphate/cardiolipin synthase-like enzyme
VNASVENGDRNRSQRPRLSGSATSFLAIGLLIGFAIGASAVYLAFNVLRQAQTPTLGQLELLPDERYIVAVSRLIASANKSVHVIMYVAKYDPKQSAEEDPANKLLELLASAKRKGLDVRVVVDDVTRQSYPETIDFLKSRNVPVRLDPKASVTTHAKVVIVDGEWVVIGSHNWSESALKENREYSVLIRSSDIAADVKDYFEELWNGGRNP